MYYVLGAYDQFACRQSCVVEDGDGVTVVMAHTQSGTII